jgi:hypothetical protein
VTAQECLATVRRRWYVLALIMLIALCGVWIVHKRPIMYQACDGLYVAAPKVSSLGNTYVTDSPSLAVTTNIVVQVLMAQSMQQRVSDQGLTANYQVTQTNTGDAQFPTYTQPTAQVCSTARDPQTALRTTNSVTTDFSRELYQLQVGQHVPATSLITAIVLTKAIPIPIVGHQSQAYVGIMLCGLFTGTALLFWSDSVLARWNAGKPRPRRQDELADGHL